MTSTKKLIIICDSDLSKEPRVIRQIIALKDKYDICTVGAQASAFIDIDHINFIDFPNPQPTHWKYPMPVRKFYSAVIHLKEKINYKRAKSFEKEYWTKRRKDILQKLSKKSIDLVICHHWDTLPLGVELKKAKGCKVIFNAHDYYQRQFEANPLWVKGSKPLVSYIMNTYARHVDLVFAAWEKIATDYSAFYKVPVVIVGNQTEYKNLPPVINDGRKIRIVHHGIANANRQLELMFDVMEHLDEKYELYFMLVYNKHNQAYYEMLKQRSIKDGRIKFIEPVETRNIPERINEFDVGLFLLPPTDFNTTYLIPNKLYEFIQARLVCAVSPNVEMKKVVNKYKLGIVTEDYSPRGMAAKIKSLSVEDINAFKRNADSAAQEVSAEHNYKLINESVESLIPA